MKEEPRGEGGRDGLCGLRESREATGRWEEREGSEKIGVLDTPTPRNQGDRDEKRGLPFLLILVPSLHLLPL